MPRLGGRQTAAAADGDAGRCSIDYSRRQVEFELESRYSQSLYLASTHVH
jgi:hypothetical protein